MVRLVSGGQTGVDRAALDVALALGLDHGGWCPRGRCAEDGRIPPRYRLRETPDARYAVRTAWNVRDADATLILAHGPLRGGTELTRRQALAQARRLLVVDLVRPPDPARVAAWLAANRVAVLNVAGPRESGRPGIHRLAFEFLMNVLRPGQRIGQPGGR